jgi:Cu+-exporting ATPase
MQGDNADLKESDKYAGDKNSDSCSGCNNNDSQNLKEQAAFTNRNFEYQDHEMKERVEEEKRDDAFRALIIMGLTLTIAIVTIEIFVEDNSGKGVDFLLLSLATPIQIVLGKPFYIRFYNSLRRKRRFTVDTLVVLSTSVAFSYSVIAILGGQDVRFFEASASVLTIFTIGEYLEARVLRTSSESVKKLIALKPKTAVVIRIRSDGKQQEEEQEVNVDEIMVGDIVVVKPGQTVSTDGVIIGGESSVDESSITGESIPVDKKLGDTVIGGTINKYGYLRIKAVNVGSQTVLANIIEMVKKARSSKPSIQRIADIAAMYFIPVVLLIAVGASLYWALFVHASVQFVVTVFATVLVVSCPCALGIATPMVVSLGIGKAAREGVLIKGGEYLEKLAHIDTVVFDKTGTLTKGKPEVTDIIANDNHDESTVLQIAYSVEIKSGHPIAEAIVAKAKELNIQTLEVSQFNAISGHGVVAKYLDKAMFVGSPRLAKGEGEGPRVVNNIPIGRPLSIKMQAIISKLESEGKTVVTVFLERDLVGLIGLADTLRHNARQTVQEVKSMGKRAVILTGDNGRTAWSIAKRLDIETVIAEVTPDQKSSEIMSLQAKHGNRVAMIGDGINDAPALIQADVGIAMGSGTDIAISAGHVILIKNDLAGIIYALKIGDYTLKKIKQNLLISFAYNSITIPLAAGILYSLTNSLVLTPSLAALGWIISDSAVFGNSMLVKRYNKKNARQQHRCNT